MSFEDRFGVVADTYARARPTYPPALFAWIAANSPGRARAWDCGAGSGQAAHGLAREFDEVWATDASQAQLDAFPPHPRIRTSCAPAEASGLPDGRAQAIVVAQAMHWFDLPAFFAEVRRVAAPDALLAVWTYARFALDDPALHAAFEAAHATHVEAFWPPERERVESGYADVVFPFRRVEVPPFELEVAWDLPALLAYVGTWSARQQRLAAGQGDLVPLVAEAIAAHWGPPERVRRVRWPLSVHALRC